MVKLLKSTWEKKTVPLSCRIINGRDNNELWYEISAKTKKKILKWELLFFNFKFLIEIKTMAKSLAFLHLAKFYMLYLTFHPIFSHRSLSRTSSHVPFLSCFRSALTSLVIFDSSSRTHCFNTVKRARMILSASTLPMVCLT